MYVNVPRLKKKGFLMCEAWNLPFPSPISYLSLGAPPTSRSAPPLRPPPHKPPRMPPAQSRHGQHHRRKLQRAKKRLMRTRIPHNPLRRLRQAKARPQIDQQTTPHDRGRKTHHATLAPRHGRFPRIHDEQAQQEEKKQEGKDLEGEAGEKDIVCGVGGSAVGLGGADEGCAGDLDDGGDDVGGDEDGDDGFAGEAQGAEVRAHVGDQGGEGGVECGGEEDGGDDDEEVLHDEVDHVVGVADGGWGGLEAEGVADDFADGG